MKGSDLKYLAKVCDLARVDIDTNAPLLLRGDSNDLEAHYRGSYSSAFRTVDSDIGDIDFIVGSKQFKASAAIFDDDEDVKVSKRKQELVLQGQDSRMVLRGSDRDIEPMELPSDSRTALITNGKDDDGVSRSLLEEFDIASTFIAKSMARPVFTGVKIILSKRAIGIESSDGSGLIYRSSMPCVGPAQRVAIVVPTTDFLLGLQLCDGPELEITAMEGKVCISGNGAGFDVALLSGTWPDLPMKKDPLAREVNLTASILKRAVAAVRALDGSNDLKFVPAPRGGINLETESEQGGFVAHIAGDLLKEAAFDIESLAMLTDIGTDLTFEVSLDAPLFVHNGSRKAWLMARGR